MRHTINYIINSLILEQCRNKSQSHFNASACMLLFLDRAKRVVRVENPQYKMNRNGNEEVMIGVGPTVRFALKYMCKTAYWTEIFQIDDILAMFSCAMTKVQRS